jgi:hypothetical protein
MPLEQNSPVVALGVSQQKRSTSAKTGAKRRQSAPKAALLQAPASAPKVTRIDQHPASMSHVQLSHGHKCQAKDIGHSACLAKGCKACAHIA